MKYQHCKKYDIPVGEISICDKLPECGCRCDNCEYHKDYNLVADCLLLATVISMWFMIALFQ